MQSATRSHKKSSQKSHSKPKLEEEYASKKKRLQPFPEDTDNSQHSNSKKMKTGTKSISKSKLSTQKKCEVTFSDNVEEIRDNNEASSQKSNDKENVFLLSVTPLKTSSPSKQSLKSVKEHIKTPFSKIKDNADEGADSASLINSASSKTNQPNFNSEILNESAGKSAGKKESDQKIVLSEKKVNENTPKRTSARKFGSEMKSFSKSPLRKIKEDVIEEQMEEKIPSQRKEKMSSQKKEKMSSQKKEKIEPASEETIEIKEVPVEEKAPQVEEILEPQENIELPIEEIVDTSSDN